MRISIIGFIKKIKCKSWNLVLFGFSILVIIVVISIFISTNIFYLDIIFEIFTFLASLFVLFAGGLHFTRVEQSNHPWILKLKGKKISFVIIAIVFSLICPCAKIKVKLLKNEIKSTLGFLRQDESVLMSNADNLKKEFLIRGINKIKNAEKFFEIGNRSLNERNYNDAEKFLKKSIEEIPTLSSMLDLSVALYLNCKVEEAMKISEQGIAKASREGYLLLQIVFLANRAYMLSYIDKQNDALICLEEAQKLLDLADKNKIPPAVRNNLQFAQSSMLIKFKKFSEALSILEVIRHTLNNQKDLAIILMVEYNIAVCHNESGNYDKAFSNLNKLSLKINALGFKDDDLKARILTSFGCYYLNLNKYDKAGNYFLEALDINKRIGYKRGIAISLNNLAATYLGQDEIKLKTSLDLALEAKKIISEIKYNRIKMNNTILLGKIYKQLKSYELSLSYLNQAKEYQRNIDKKEFFPELDIDIAQSLCMLNKADEAIELLQKDLGVFAKNKNISGIAATLINLGNCYSSKNGFYEAHKLYMEAIRVADIGKEDKLEEKLKNQTDKLYSNVIDDCSEALANKKITLEERIEITNKRGFYYILIKKYDNAQKDLSEVLRINPKLEVVRNNLSFSYYERGKDYLTENNIIGAEESLKKSLYYQNRNIFALTKLSETLSKKGEHRQAYKYIKKAIKNNSTDKEVLDNYGHILMNLARQYYDNSKYIEALNLIDEGLIAFPSVHDFLFFKSDCYFKLKNYSECEKYALKYLNFKDGNYFEKARLLFIKSLINMSKTQKAIALLAFILLQAKDPYSQSNKEYYDLLKKLYPSHFLFNFKKRDKIS